MIGQRIKGIREGLGMSQSEMAEKLGVLPQTVYKYEKGIVTNIPISVIEVIAKLGNVSPAYILGWEEPKHDADHELLEIARKLDENQVKRLLGYAQALLDMEG